MAATPDSPCRYHEYAWECRNDQHTCPVHSYRELATFGNDLKRNSVTSSAALASQADALAVADGAGDLAELCIHRLNRVNRILDAMPRDPAMLEIKETLTQGLVAGLKHYMLRGTGVVEEIDTIQRTRQTRRY
jgi:hypothetical protein